MTTSVTIFSCVNGFLFLIARFSIEICASSLQIKDINKQQPTFIQPANNHISSKPATPWAPAHLTPSFTWRPHKLVPTLTPPETLCDILETPSHKP